MNRIESDKLNEISSKRTKADLCIRNAKVVDVFNREVFESDILISGKYFAGFAKKGEGLAKVIKDAKGSYVIPGFIDSHVHIESSHCSPSEFSNLLIPNGVTTVIADPHEICNCSGLSGLDYMLEACERLPLNAYFMIPSCVPATSVEHSGAIILAKDIETRINNDRVLGLGEMMDYPGVISGNKMIHDKLQVARDHHKVIDGHSPNIYNTDLDTYAASGILTDHECENAQELQDRVRRGMYVMVRQGTVCQDETNLLKGVTEQNYHRCLFCTDDRQAESLVNEGSINNNVRLAVSEGLDPLMAINMASINSATCYHLKSLGAIAPGYIASFSITPNLKDFNMEEVYVEGQLVAVNGKILKESEPMDLPSSIESKINIKNFSKDRLKLKLKKNKVRTIDIIPGGVVTAAGEASVIVKNGEFIYDPSQDIAKIAVIERHHGTGNVAVALLRGYGIKSGAIATSVAHDSHNIIVCGTTDNDMELAVNELVRIGGGMAIADKGRIIGSFAHPIAGLMSCEKAPVIIDSLTNLSNLAHNELGVSRLLDPFMTLCFMSLPVIPVYKITDMGLFDVRKFDFVDIEL
ncbi:MAG: adenine deaminase [Spirochaetaceae bacterium]|nr:adenine deaminase [Spirochaetaceae bacterium]